MSRISNPPICLPTADIFPKTVTIPFLLAQMVKEHPPIFSKKIFMKKRTLALALFFAFMAAGFAQKLGNSPQFFTVADPDFELVFEINAFPNPATERLMVETDFPYPVVFRLFSRVGQCAKSGQLTGGEIGVGELPNGSYCLELRTAAGRLLTALWIKKW